LPFISGAVARPDDFKRGELFSERFVGNNSWNGYEAKCLFLNLGNGKFVDVSRPAGCDDTRDGRGVAIADFNHDGKLDIVINNNNAPPTIYINRLPDTGRWFRCVLEGKPDGTGERHRSSRSALGARVTLTLRSNGTSRQISRWVEAGSGYASQSETTLHFGLGQSDSIEGLMIAWPSGRLETVAAERLRGLSDRECTIREGAGILTERVTR
jgi:enediyne biosynthesis protein E4